jgi:hypothetical protein
MNTQSISHKRRFSKKIKLEEIQRKLNFWHRLFLAFLNLVVEHAMDKRMNLLSTNSEAQTQFIP